VSDNVNKEHCEDKMLANQEISSLRRKIIKKDIHYLKRDNEYLRDKVKGAISKEEVELRLKNQHLEYLQKTLDDKIEKAVIKELNAIKGQETVGIADGMFSSAGAQLIIKVGSVIVAIGIACGAVYSQVLSLESKVSFLEDSQVQYEKHEKEFKTFESKYKVTLTEAENKHRQCDSNVKANQVSIKGLVEKTNSMKRDFREQQAMNKTEISKIKSKIKGKK